MKIRTEKEVNYLLILNGVELEGLMFVLDDVMDSASISDYSKGIAAEVYDLLKENYVG